MIDRLALAELHLGFAQHFDDLFRRVPLPCNSRRSSSEVANSQIRSNQRGSNSGEQARGGTAALPQLLTSCLGVN
jgi:hypothetical protein